MSNTPPDPRAELTDKLADIQRDAGNFLGRLSFSSSLDSLNDAVKDLQEAEESARRLRARGYQWRGDVEEKLAQAKSIQESTVRQVQSETQEAGRSLRRRIDQLADQARAIASRGDVLRQKSAIEALDGERDGLDNALDAAENRIKALYEPFATPVREAQSALKDLHWTLDQFDAASFKLLPDESIVACAQVTWEDPPDGEKKKGVLLFSDHRVRFEHRDEIVTKKSFFFFAAEKEKVQKVLIDEPIGHLAASDDATRGWVMKDQLLTFTWAREAKGPKKTTFELESGTAKDWDQTVETLRSGDIGRHRYQGLTQKTDAVGMPVSWPEKCIACGASLTPPVKGQTTIACGYCGQAHDVVMSTG